LTRHLPVSATPRLAASCLALAAVTAALVPAAQAQSRNPPARSAADTDERLRALEAELAALRAEVAAARNESATRPEGLRGTQPTPSATAPAPARAAGLRVGNTEVRIGGAIKAEALYSRFNDGEVDGSSLGRDFHLPSAIPTNGVTEGTYLDAHVKQTRITLTTSTPVGGDTLGAYFEGDFQSAPGMQGSTRTTNAYNFAVRRAFVTHGGWLVGQDWSTFQNTAMMPETADFIGITEGTVFVRQPLVRYSFDNGLVVALEAPETEVRNLAGVQMAMDDSRLPDLVVRWNADLGEAVSVSVAGLVRELRIVEGLTEVDDLGWGVSLATKVRVGPTDDLRVTVNGGRGIGRYLALNTVDDAAYRVSPLEFQPISVYSGAVSYRHFWTRDLRSTVGGAFLMGDNPIALTGPLVTSQAWSAFGNVFWTPVPTLDLGLEYRRAARELEANGDGTMDRVHIVARRAF